MSVAHPASLRKRARLRETKRREARTARLAVKAPALLLIPRKRAPAASKTPPGNQIPRTHWVRLEKRACWHSTAGNGCEILPCFAFSANLGRGRCSGPGSGMRNVRNGHPEQTRPRIADRR
eukprot:1780013-Rhodomonas_salina.1